MITQEIPTIDLKGAEVSKTIKELLKAKFPKTKFSVRYSSFSMGNDVKISYEFGPGEEVVDALVQPYAYGTFDAMEDYWDFKGPREVETKDGIFMLKHGVKYVNVEKKIPDMIYNEMKEFSQEYNIEFHKIRQLYKETDFGTDKPEKVQLNLIQGFAVFSYEIPKEKATEIPELLEYSPYSVALFNTHRAMSGDLKQMGGRYNKFLKHPKTQEKTPGWIFSKKSLADLESYLTAINHV